MGRLQTVITRIQSDHSHQTSISEWSPISNPDYSRVASDSLNRNPKARAARNKMSDFPTPPRWLAFGWKLNGIGVATAVAVNNSH